MEINRIFIHNFKNKIMRVQVKFSALDENLKRISFLKTYESSHEFKDKEVSLFELNNHFKKPFLYSALEQADEWISDLDKSDLMMQKNLHTIINWEVTELGKKQKKEKKIQLSVKEKVFNTTLEMFQNSEYSARLSADFLVCYIEMYEEIKNLTIEKQISIVLKSMGIGYTASTVTMDNHLEYCSMLSELSLEELQMKHWTSDELREYLETKNSRKSLN